MICAVLITAYQSTDYILDSIESILNQQLPDGWNLKLYIGVDNCIDTSNLLFSKKIDYYYSKENVGTYVLSNSLIQQAKKDNSDVYVRFDSDDVADKNFLLYGIPYAQECHFFRPYLIKCDNNLVPLTNEIIRATGSSFFDNYALDCLGGYQNYRVACDTDFFKRAEMAGFVNKDVNNKPVYFYRQHKSSLMNNVNTSKKSSLRKISWKKMTEFRDNGNIKVNPPVTTALSHITF